MDLPLLIRAEEGGEQFLLTPAAPGAQERSPSACMTPNRLPVSGEQYRFHLDMTQCIGCKCCVVACNEQNGNPAEIQWRRVGEIEGGVYPDTLRHYLSMGCNHCLEPTCMTGCPVNAYTKDPLTGIVLHSAERCIGCQYCTWNCSYGVPQYNPERGVVGQMRHVPRTSFGWTRAGVCGRLSGRGYPHRDRERGRVASRVWSTGQCAGTAECRRQHLDNQNHHEGYAAARHGPRGCLARGTGASALDPDLHDRLHSDGCRGDCSDVCLASDHRFCDRTRACGSCRADSDPRSGSFHAASR